MVNSNLIRLEKVLGVSFRDKNLLLQAITHKSYINVNKSWPVGHYERLEFLGDAVLEILVTQHLYDTFPEKNEGELTVIRTALVCTTTLSMSASKMCLLDFMYLDNGARKDTGRAHECILACVFEAILGAMYIDSGHAVAREFVTRHIFCRIEDALKQGPHMNHKSKVQETAQERLGVTPSYQTLDESGADHDKTFTCGVFFGEKLIAKGKGKTKGAAEARAARVAVSIRGWV